MKILLYKERKMTECLEATFDFLRANRRVWFRSALLLFLPLCVVNSFLLFSSYDMDRIGMNANPHFWMENFFDRTDNYSFSFMVMTYVVVWMVFVQVFSLLLANEESADGVEGMSLKELRPRFISTAKCSWYLPLVFVALLILLMVPGLNILVAVCMVPLALLPALHIIERLNVANAASKALSLGFPIWFKLAFNIVLVSLLGLYVFVVLFLPTLFLQWMKESLSTSQLHELERLFVIATGFVFTILAFFGLYVVSSMVVLLCAFHYGSSSEEKDASSLEGEVADFGNEG